MKSAYSARSVLLGLALGLGCAAAEAQERPLFESLNGWQVERAASITGSNTCVIVRSYVDEDDEDTDNSVTFALENKALVVALTYSKWRHDKDATFVAATELGGKTVNAKTTWTGDGTRIVATLPASLVEKAADSEEFVVKTKSGKASFDLTGASVAFEAMKRCNAGGKPNRRS